MVLWRAGSHFRDCLRAHLSTPDRHLCDLSVVIDWESMWLLPKFIVFESENGFYLSGRRRHNLPYLPFLSQSLEDPSIMMETISNVVFYLPGAKIYNEVVIVLATREAKNNFNVPNTVRITF